MDAVTQARIVFDRELSVWAMANGYKRRGGLWRSGANYIAVRRGSDGGPFIAQQTAYETGARIADVELRAAAAEIFYAAQVAS